MTLRKVSLLGLLLVCCASIVSAQESLPVVTVQGNGQLEVEPDLAVVRLGVTAMAGTAAQAQHDVNATLDRVLRALDELVPRDDIETSRISLSPVYGREERHSGARIEAYRATNRVSVKIGDLSRVGAVIDAASGAGVNEIEGISFELKDDREARRRALAAAVEDANLKAAAVAAALGRTLGPVLEVNEAGVGIQPVYQARIPMSEAASFGAQVLPGDITVTASVTVRFALNRR